MNDLFPEDKNHLVKTREGDPPELAERLRRARGEGRRRTVVMSIIASGLVSLVIGNFVERQADNNQVDRSRKNCETNNSDRRDTANSLDEQSDNILGDETTKDGDPNEGVVPFTFEGSGFEKFKPLVVAQARAQRMRSREYFARIENCNATFPKRSVIPFVD